MFTSPSVNASAAFDLFPSPCFFVSRLYKCKCKRKCNLFTHGAPRSSQELVQKCPHIPGSNWNLEMLLFKERRKPEYPEKSLSKQRRKPKPDSTHMWRRVRESNPGHIGRRRALSLLRHPSYPSFQTLPCLAKLFVVDNAHTAYLPSLKLLLSRSSLEPLISMDLVGTKLHCFRARVHCYHCLYDFLTQSCETFRRASWRP